MANYTGEQNKTSTVTRSSASYEQALAARTTLVPEDIDFEQSSVVFLDMGQRNSGGYQISVESVVEQQDYVTVNVRLSIPGGNCLVTLALTNPMTIVQIDTVKEILFTEELVVYSC